MRKYIRTYAVFYWGLGICMVAVLQAVPALSQSAVYVCKESGRYGVAWDDGNAPRMTMEETKKEARKRCVEQGGEDCQLFFSSDIKGWYSFFKGDEKGKHLFSIGKSLVSEKEAIKKAIDDYMQKGGIIHPGCITSSWHAPKDAIKVKKQNR